MSTDIPIGEVKPIVHTSVPVTDDGTLVDDTSVLVDGSQLVGGQTTPLGNLSPTIKSLVPRPTVKIKR